MAQDFNQIMEAAKKIQGQMQKAQQDIAAFTATAGTDSHCTAVVDGKHQIRKIKLNESFIREEPIEFIEEMIANAVNQAMSKVEEEMKSQMMNMTKDLGLDMDKIQEQAGDAGSGDDKQ